MLRGGEPVADYGLGTIRGFRHSARMRAASGSSDVMIHLRYSFRASLVVKGGNSIFGQTEVGAGGKAQADGPDEFPAPLSGPSSSRASVSGLVRILVLVRRLCP
jgi:hypothetical protein